MPAQRLDDLDATRDGGTEVIGAAHRIAMVEVVGPDTHQQQTVTEGALGRLVVVDTAQQDRLVVEGNPGAAQAIAGERRVRRDLVRMVDLQIDPERMMACQHRGEFVVDAHRQADRHPRADTDDLDVGDGAQAAEDAIEPLGGEGQGSPPETTTSRMVGVRWM